MARKQQIGPTTKTYQCADMGDHKCPGPDLIHIGMVVTIYAGVLSTPYRVVWCGDSGLKAVVMRLDHLDGTALATRPVFGHYSHGYQPGKMIARDSDGKWWEAGRKWANKRPLTMGVGIDHNDPGV